MATQPSNDTISEHLKYQTWVLKVSIHCEGCKKKVHKILHNIEGVFTVSIDSQQHKVSVTGNVEAEKLIKKLAKAGKHAEIVHENVGEGDKTGKAKKNKKKKKNNPDNAEKASGDEDHDQANHIKEKDEVKDPPKSSDENDVEDDEKPNPTGNSGKKKKKKGKKGNNADDANAKEAPAFTESSPTAVEAVDQPMGMMHLGPPFGHVYSFPASYYPPQTFGLSYSTSHPSGTSSYYAPPAYGYNHTYAMYRPPPPSDQIRAYNNYHHDEVYVENDGEGSCSIM